jgi:cellulose synthase/poly-beta-1,6-N-acetylglucosamine synthase-like glycosyltransferase
MSEALPRLTVIIPAWGTGPFLGEALSSLQAQTRGDWEAVVIDDGDTDAVAAAVAPFRADNRIRLLQTDNRGPSAARNRGIAASRTPFVSMLDGDDRYRRDYVERMIAAIEADPRLGFVTSDARMFGTPNFEGKLFSETQSQAGEITLERVLRRQYNVCGASIVRREAMDAVGGYDEQLRSAEDLDLWIRILEHGWHAVRVDAPLIEYRRRAGSLSTRSLSMAHWDRQVLSNAVERLEGPPEQAAAREMLARADNALRIETGLADVVAGRTREGLRTLQATDIAQRSRKWRLAFAAFRLFPALAGPAIRFYMRRHPFAE